MEFFSCRKTKLLKKWLETIEYEIWKRACGLAKASAALALLAALAVSACVSPRTALAHQDALGETRVGDLRFGGEVSYDGKIGNFRKYAQDPLTLALSPYLFTNDDQWLSGKLKVENLHNIGYRQVVDFKNYFFGASHTPQDLGFRNVSTLYDNLSLNWGVAHTTKTISSLYLDGMVSNFSFSRLQALSKSDVSFGYMIDHKTTDNTYYTLKLQNSIDRYATHSADDYDYATASFKILHRMPKVSRSPSYFTEYVFFGPCNDDPDYVHYTDLTYELKAEYGKNKIAAAPGAGYQNLKVDYSLHMDFSPVAKINLNGYVDRRVYNAETVATYMMNYDKSYLNLLYSHDLTPRVTMSPYLAMIKYNYLNISGFNVTELDAGFYYSYKYSEDIYWNFDLKRSAIFPFQSRVNFPSQNRLNFVSSWIKYLSGRRRLVLDLDYEFMNAGYNETIYYADYGQTATEFRYEQRINDNFYVRCGLGARAKKHDNFPTNDLYGVYGLIGLTAVF